MASVSDINPAKRATNIGAVMTAQGVGAMIGAPIGAAMYEKFQPLGQQLGLGASFGRYSPFVGCAICVIAGLLLSLKILHEPKAITALPNESDVVAEAVVISEETISQETLFDDEELDVDEEANPEEILEKTEDETKEPPTQ
jgi:MFS family permease